MGDFWEDVADATREAPAWLGEEKGWQVYSARLGEDVAVVRFRGDRAEGDRKAARWLRERGSGGSPGTSRRT